MVKRDLYDLFVDRITGGLKRKSITSCSKWAETYRVMGAPFPGKWSFKRHPWLREMHDSSAEFNVGQKAAQMGFTETGLNITFYHIDIKGIDCLYVLPARNPDASDFSASRFDSALELSPHLSTLFSDVKNVGHKRAGNSNLYVRGSRSRAGLKSIPTGLIILDEVDEMTEENIPLAMERASGQLTKLVWAFSTPSIPGIGINKLYRETTQEKFHFRCPSCSRFIYLSFPENILITAESLHDSTINDTHLICNYCKAHLPHQSKIEWLSTGEWVPQYTQRASRGFGIPQLYSSTVQPAEIAKSFFKAQRDPAEEQEFHNSKMGEAHIVEGAAVTDVHLDRCIGHYKRAEKRPSGVITMGVDVGKWLHYEIDQWYVKDFTPTIDLNARSSCRVINFGKVIDFEELDVLMRQWGINFCVIDAMPEQRKSYEFASRFPGRVRTCFYGMGITGKQFHFADGLAQDPRVTVDRTSWLDLSLGRFRSDPPSITIPMDTNQEYRNHIKSLVRIYEKDKHGNPVGKYIQGSDEDHYAHARNYSEIALQFASQAGMTQSINVL